MNCRKRMGVGVVLAVFSFGGWWWHVSATGKDEDQREDEKSAWYETYRNCRDRAHDLSRDFDQSRDCARGAFATNRARH
jgi:hypothetical protein